MKFVTAASIVMLCLLGSLQVGAQQSKKKVQSAGDLPRFSYDVPETLTDLATDEAAYRAFASKVRSDLEGVLRDYDIEDKPTLKSIHSALGEPDASWNQESQAQ